MKKAVIILIGILIIYSCKNSKKSIYEGSWIDKKTEMIQVSIIYEKDSYWLLDYKGKSLIEEKGKNYFINLNSKEYAISIDNGKLYFLENEFIPESMSLKKQFVGLWKAETAGKIFEIKNINGGLVWDIKEEDNKSVRYYPKITETGFTFTYKNKDLSFIIKNEFMLDSKGVKYYKTSSEK